MDQRDDALPDDGYGGNRLEQYLHPGEELLISSEKIGIKKFLFTACLTTRRLFLIDQNETRAGVTAKEIPIEYIVERYLDLAPGMDPVLVLSVRTSDDDMRTMKLRFIQSGPDRTPEVEQWMVMFRDGRPARGGPVREQIPATPVATERPAAPTMVWPGEPETPPAPRGETIIMPVSPPRQERAPAPDAPVPEPRVQEPWPQEARTPRTAEVPERRMEPAPRSSEPVRVYEPVPVSRPTPSPRAGTGSAEVLYCYHCGKNIPRMANFCPFCGTPTHDPGRPANGNPAPAPRNVTPVRPDIPAEKPKKRSFWGRMRGKE